MYWPCIICKRLGSQKIQNFAVKASKQASGLKIDMATLERGDKNWTDRHETPLKMYFSDHILKQVHNHTRKQTLPEVTQPWQIRTKEQQTLETNKRSRVVGTQKGNPESTKALSKGKQPKQRHRDKQLQPRPFQFHSLQAYHV